MIQAPTRQDIKFQNGKDPLDSVHCGDNNNSANSGSNFGNQTEA